RGGRQTTVERSKWNSAQADLRCGVHVCSRLCVAEMAVVVAEPELVNQAVRKIVRFAQDKVIAKVLDVAIASVAASIKDGAQRRRIKRSLIEIAEASKCLIFLADDPIQTRVPLKGIIRDLPLKGVVVEELPIAGVG